MSIKKTVEQIYNLMIDGKWRTLAQIATGIGVRDTHYVSSMLTTLKKERNVSIYRRRFDSATNGIYEYSMSDELTPHKCPFCASSSVMVNELRCVFSVCCTACDAEGPSSDTNENAILAWNTRLRA